MNQLALMLTAYLALVGQPDNLRPVADDEWQSYKVAYNKSYESQQIELLRRSVYAANKAKLETLNAGLKEAGAGYSVGVNRFTDRTPEELRRSAKFARSYEPQRMSADDQNYVRRILDTNKQDPIPDEFDWRKIEGRVSEVKDQGNNCDAKWAFAATGLLEGWERSSSLNFSQLVVLSEQHLIDCTDAKNAFPTVGCLGGYVENALVYVSQMGVTDQKSYPYKGKWGNCPANAPKPILMDRGYVRLPADEELMRQVLYKAGPISVALDDDDLGAYSNGVYSHNCPSPTYYVKDAYLLVGYGIDDHQGPYWIVKNNWGKDWGEGGYFRLARDKDSSCVSRHAVIPKF